MSLTNMARIMVRAIESRNCRTAAERENVYALSRQTLERFFEENSALSEYDKSRERHELELAIEKIEAAFTVVEHTGPEPARAEPMPERTEPAPAPKPVPSLPPAAPPEPTPPPARPPVTPPPAPPSPPAAPPEPTAPPAPRPPSPPAPPVATPSPTAPPSAPAEPSAPVETPTAADDRLASPEAEKPADDDDGLFGAVAEDTEKVEEDEEEIEEDGEVVSHAQPDRTPPISRMRRRLAAALVFLALLVLGVYHLGEVGERVHRYLVDFQFEPEKESAMKAIAPAATTETDAWPNVVRAKLEAAVPPGVTTAFHWDGSKGPIEKGSAGIVTWAAAPDVSGTLAGTMTFDDGSPSADLAVTITPRAADPDLLGFMMIVRFDGDVEKTLYSPTLVRIDRTTGRSEDVNATGVRIGIDRAMFGFDADRRKLTDDITTSRTYRMAFTSESDVRNLYWLRLPPTLANMVEKLPADP